MDFVHTYWHVDCVRSRSLDAFTEHYQHWCKRKGYNFSADKAEKIYQLSSDLIAVFPKDDSTKMLIRQAVSMLNTASGTVESLRQKMDETAATLPEYPVVMAMNGVGPTLGPQLMAEIEDVTRFTHRGALTAFAGVDPGKNDSGQYVQKSVRTSRSDAIFCLHFVYTPQVSAPEISFLWAFPASVFGSSPAAGSFKECDKYGRNAVFIAFFCGKYMKMLCVQYNKYFGNDFFNDM